jgi:hypothetical protein
MRYMLLYPKQVPRPLPIGPEETLAYQNKSAVSLGVPRRRDAASTGIWEKMNLS